MAVADQFETVQKLYIAFYQRPADFAGRQYWAEQVEAQGLSSVINAFATSAEATALYGEINNETIGDVIDAIYQAAFGRAADAEGKAWYVAEFEAGNFTAATIALNVVNGAAGVDATTLGNKVEAADLFTAAVEGVEYNEADITAARDFLAGVTDTVPTQEEVDAVVEQVAGEAPAEGTFAAYEAAIEAFDAASDAYAAALVDAGVSGVTENADGTYSGFAPATTDYVLGAEQAVLNARSALNADRTSNGTDASLQQTLQQAQTAVNNDAARYDILGNEVTVAANGSATYAETPTEANGSTALKAADGTTDLASGDAYVGSVYTAAQLQARANTAEAALDAHEAGKGSTLELATQLEDAIALYQATQATANTDLSPLVSLIDSLQAAGTALAADPTDAALQGTFESAQNALYAGIDSAYDAVFQVGTANAGKSELETGARGDAVEALLVTLNERADLAAADDTASAVFEGKVNTGAAFASAEDAVEGREALIEAITAAQANLEAISAADADYQAAVESLETATDALGFDVQAIDGAIELATSEADLFVFDAEAVEGIDAIFINNLGSDDQILLGSDYVLGTAGQGNNNVLEVFVTELNGSAVLQIENSVYGSNDGNDGDFTTITLTGVAAADVTVENGVVSFA